MMKLQNNGFVNMNIYDTLQQILEDSNPSYASILTPSFLKALHDCPASSDIFTKKIQDCSQWMSIVIGTDGRVQASQFTGATYLNAQGTSSLDTQISGKYETLNFRAIYSTTQTPITTFDADMTTYNTTYNIFAILYIPSASTTGTTATPTQTIGTTQPTPTTPEFPTIAIIPIALALLFTAVLLKQKKPKTLLSLNCC